MPTVFAFGTSFFKSDIWAAQGVRSEVPVTFVPGASFETTSFADSGSVTEEITTGMSFVRFATA